MYQCMYKRMSLHVYKLMYLFKQAQCIKEIITDAIGLCMRLCINVSMNEHVCMRACKYDVNMRTRAPINPLLYKVIRNRIKQPDAAQVNTILCNRPYKTIRKMQNKTIQHNSMQSMLLSRQTPPSSWKRCRDRSYSACVSLSSSFR